MCPALCILPVFLHCSYENWASENIKTFGLKTSGYSLGCCGRAFVCQYVGYLSQEWISHKWGLLETHDSLPNLSASNETNSVQTCWVRETQRGPLKRRLKGPNEKRRLMISLQRNSLLACCLLVSV